MTDIEHVIKDLERKANISREIHIYSSKKCRKWGNLILILTIGFTMVITFFSLAGPLLFQLGENGRIIFGIIIAIAGLLILILSISDRIFGLNERYSAHIQGVNLLTDFIRECHQFRHTEIKTLDEEKKLMTLRSFQDKYSQIHQLLPLDDISDIEFLKIKQNYYLKVEVSKKLDDDPHLNVEEAIKSH